MPSMSQKPGLLSQAKISNSIILQTIIKDKRLPSPLGHILSLPEHPSSLSCLRHIMNLLEVFPDKTISPFLPRLNKPISLTSPISVISLIYLFRLLPKNLLSHPILLNILLVIHKCRIQERLNPNDNILKKCPTKVSNKSTNFLTFLLMLLVVFMSMVSLMIVMKERWLISLDLFLDSFRLG